MTAAPPPRFARPKTQKTSQSRFRFREGKCDVFVVVGQPPLATCKQNTAGSVPSVLDGSRSRLYEGLMKYSGTCHIRVVTLLVQCCRIVVRDALLDRIACIAGKPRSHRSWVFQPNAVCLTHPDSQPSAAPTSPALCQAHPKTCRSELGLGRTRTMNDDAVCLMNRVGWFAGKPRSNRYTTKPVGAHEQCEAAMAVSLTHRNRWPRNLSHTASLVGVAGGHDGDECSLSDTRIRSLRQLLQVLRRVRHTPKVFG